MLRELVTPHWISLRMDEGNVTCRQLADALGVTDRVVSLWRNGKRRPDVGNTEKLLHFFGYEIEVRHV